MKNVEASIQRRIVERGSFDSDRMQTFLDNLERVFTSYRLKVVHKEVVTYHVLTEGKGLLTFSLGENDTKESLNLSPGLDITEIAAALSDANFYAHKERMAIALGVSKSGHGLLSIEVVTL